MYILNLHPPSILAGKWPDRHQTFTRDTMDSRSACIQGVLKVKVKVKGHVIRAQFYCAGRKIASSPTQMTGSMRQVCNLTFLPFQ